MDMSSPFFLIVVLIGAFIGMKFIGKKKDVKKLRIEKERVNLEHEIHKTKFESRKLKDEERAYKKKNGGGNW